jgi:hypothetical protein
MSGTGIRFAAFLLAEPKPFAMRRRAIVGVIAIIALMFVTAASGSSCASMPAFYP